MRDERDDLPAQDLIRVEQPRQDAAEETLPQTGKRPRPGLLQRRRPVAVQVAGAHRLVQQRLGLQHVDHPGAQRLSGAGVAGAEIDDLEAAPLAAVGQRHEAVAGPHLLPRRGARLGDLRADARPLRAVVLGAQDALVQLVRHPLPGEPQLDRAAQLAARLARAPDQRAGVEPRRAAPFAGPAAGALDDAGVVRPLLVGVQHHQRQAR